MGGFRGYIRAFFGALRAFLEDDCGQGTTEYILILSAAVTVTVALSKMILSTIDNGILRLGTQLEQDLKTGKAQLRVWEN